MLLLTSFACAGPSLAAEGAALGPERISQDAIASGSLSLTDIRREGLKIFATPFNHADGYGDGPLDPSIDDRTSPGNRPTLLGGLEPDKIAGRAKNEQKLRGAGNGTFLRVNGLDAQTCLECHGMISAATVPATLGVGGAAGIASNALFQARFFDVEDAEDNGYAAFDGRVINPISLFGVGGVQLLAKEMTAELQRLKKKAFDSPPGTPVKLRTKGVDFGYIQVDAKGTLITDGVEGIDPDLVVRPFGRKGEFSSVRAFDLAATQFHLGMQPVEVVGPSVDDDGDGVANELLVGEISALEIFLTTMERPRRAEMDEQAARGYALFEKLGCSGCHRPALATESRLLTYSYPEIETDPSANVFYSVDLSKAPPRFELREKGRRKGRRKDTETGGGMLVRLFSDLKRHDMGDALAESFFEDDTGRPDDRANREFVTSKLWDIADTAPYMHDGRALTLREAIAWHGGEAQPARDAFLELNEEEQASVIAFLKTLRNPRNPNSDVVPQ